MHQVKFKAKRIDGKCWVYGCLIDSVKGKHKSYFILPNEAMSYDGFEEVIPETVCVGTEINGVLVYSGDIHSELDGEGNKCLLPIVFENGSFWIDESFHKDGSILMAVSEYETPINIVGNIHD